MVSLVGLLLTGVFMMLFTTITLTQEARVQPYYRDHVDSVTRFLERRFAEAVQEGDQEESAISWSNLPDERSQDRWLSFPFNSESPLLHLPEEGYSPFSAQAWLVFDDTSGLMLVWQSDEITEDSDDETLTSLLSPYCRGMTYYFYDVEDDLWEDVPSDQLSRDEQNQLPVFVELTFIADEGGEEETRRLLLPPPSLETLPY